MSYITDSPPIPNGNGFVQHLPAEIMPSLPRKNKERGRYPPCNCCPYGYHIDLDFVRFLEALSQGSEISANKQRRRERRRQRQSMEVLLGLTSPSVWNLEQQLPQVPAEPPPPPVPPDPIRTNAMVRDALHKAVVEFEETLERSHPKPIANTILESHHSPGQHATETDGPGLGSSPMQRAESVSSVSSMSAASSTATPEQNVPNQDFDVASVGSAASGLSTGALQNIREQMAISLERMRELEEQVKLIPVLQVQLSVLKEEKRQMLLQLRLEEAERNKRNMTNHSSSIIIDHEKSSPGVETSMRVRSQSCSEGSDRNSPRSPVPSAIRSNFRDVGITCSVMTREVGISPQQPRLRNAKTNTATSLEHLGVSEIQAEDIPPDESIRPLNIKVVQSTPISIKKPETRVSATNTDLLMDQVYSDVEMDRNINKAVKTYEKSFRNKIYSKKTREIAIQAENKPEISLLIVERRDRLVQTEGKHCHRDVFSQTEDLQSHLIDVGILVKPSSSDIAIEFKPKTRDIGISDDAVTDNICEKCKVKKRSIGIGHHNITNSVDETSISLSNIGIFQNKPPDNLSIPITKQVSTRSIACGTYANVSLSQGTDTNDLNAGRSRDFGVNTTKRKLVDAAVGDAQRQSGSGVFLCDKCDAKIQNVAKNILTQNSEPSVSSPSVASVTTSASVSSRTIISSNASRIPRPATIASVTRSVTPSGLTTTAQSQEKHRIQRQDTYTKLQVSPPPVEKPRNDTSSICPAERLLAMQASAAREQDQEPGQELSGSDAEEDEGESPEDETNAIMDAGLFQPIQQEKRQKREPSKEMKAALKVLNDYLRKFPITNVPHHLKNATNIVQQEWFKISSTASANPLDVEDYLDCFEEMSSTLLEFVVNMTDMSGNTAMHYAVSHGNFDVVSILLDSKVCNINRPNAAGYTCVMLVSLAQVRSETHSQVVRRLFQLADVNVRAKQHGQTALMLAVSHGRLDMVKLLVEAGADMNIQDEDGSTALMCAAEHGHIAIVKHLISQQDCDASIVDCDGSSALNIAMDAGNKDIGVLLYAHEHFSRGSSPYTSLRHRRSKSATPTMLSGTPPSPSPVRERVSRHEQLT